jgi:hypothetical protein
VDEDLLPGDDRFAIRVAGVVDEAYHASGRDRSIDYGFLSSVKRKV